MIDESPVIRWLESKSGLQRTGDLPEYLSRDPTNLELLAEVIYKNGGKWDASQVMKEQPGVGAYGKIGLNRIELTIFIEFKGFINGCIYSSGGDSEGIIQGKIYDMIKEEIIRVDTKFSGTQILGPDGKPFIKNDSIIEIKN